VTRRILALSLMAAALPLAAADIPRKALDITLKLDNGQQTRLSAYKGKVVAVTFILTTCSHCQAASKAIEKVYQAYKGRGFEVVAIAIDPMANTKLAEFRKEQQVTFPLASDEAIVAFNFMQHPLMLRPMMPQLAFVDREGMIRAQYAGDSPFFNDTEKNVRAEVLKLLGPARPAARKTRTAKKH
jgi:peroxiredoxin